MTKDYQERDKFFYAVPSIFPKWDYPSRLAIGMNLDDFSARNAPVYRYKIKGKFYEITREKAQKIGRKITVSFGKMPHIIPIEEFTEIKPKRKAVKKPTQKPTEKVEQLSL